MIPLHCLWAKSNNRTRGQFECGMTWFCFCFDVVRFYAQCDCYSIVCGRGGVLVGVHLKLDVQGQGSGKILDLDGQGEEKTTRQFSWTSYVYRPIAFFIEHLQWLFLGVAI